MGILLVSCERESRVISIDLKISELVCRDGQHIFESRLLDLDGIKAVTTNIQTQKAQISYRENQVSAKLIKDHLLDFGFTVNGITGNASAYYRLPSCCRVEPEA